MLFFFSLKLNKSHKVPNFRMKYMWKMQGYFLFYRPPEKQFKVE